jgi:hypothetical protein
MKANWVLPMFGGIFINKSSFGEIYMVFVITNFSGACWKNRSNDLEAQYRNENNGRKQKRVLDGLHGSN